MPNRLAVVCYEAAHAKQWQRVFEVTGVGERVPAAVYRRSVPLDTLDGVRANGARHGPRVQPPDGYRDNDSFARQSQYANTQMPRGGGGSAGPGLGGQIADAAAERLAQLIASGCSATLSWGCDKVVDAYKWVRPMRPEDILRRGLFKRRDIDRMLEEAIKDNATFVMLQPHRLSDDMRRHIAGSGFRVEDTTLDDAPSVKVHLLPQAALPAAK